MLKAQAVSLVSAALLAATAAAGPDLGRPVSDAEIAVIDIDIAPDGDGLPRGEGTVVDGIDLYMDKCAACHGPRGEGVTAPALAGGLGSLATAKPVRTVGSYWPYATTLFDYIRRAMPYDRPMSLTNNETYALTAYILWLNDIVGRKDVMDAQTLPKVRMPNRDGFVNGWDAESK
ncbi:MAG: cytochrome c [Betaproteobacteria bacterium]